MRSDSAFGGQFSQLRRHATGGSDDASIHPEPPATIAAERLQKLIAAAGVCSRRGAEELLRQGRVQVNGVVAALGDRAEPGRDRISLDGRPLGPQASGITLLLNKPIGVLSTCRDPQGRPTLLDLLPPQLRRGHGLHPVGRLDAASRGAILLTNDGELTLKLTHPRYGHPKTYRVWVKGRPDPDSLERWRGGLRLGGRPSQPVRLTELRHDTGATLLEVVMREGRNRQIRRTADALGYPVLDLQRIAIGSLALADLSEGQWRQLAPAESQGLLVER